MDTRSLIFIFFIWTLLVPLACTKNYSLAPSSGARVITLAGQAGVKGSTNAAGTAASFNWPYGIAADSEGNIIVADSGNDLIRSITTSGMVSTLAGSGSPSFANGTGTAASFRTPTGVAVDALGNVYVADEDNFLIREITPAGVASTYAGSSSYTFANGPASIATFNDPWGIAIDATGNLYVADTGNSVIRLITPTGMVSTLAGQPDSPGSTNGAGTTASFDSPTGIAVDSSGNVYVGDLNNQLIRKITPDGMVATFAGQKGIVGSANGPGTLATFAYPAGVAVDASGNVYVADSGNNLIREITPGGMVSTLAGSGAAGAANGPVAKASFNQPFGVAVDASGNVYVADAENFLIREIIR